MKTVLITGGAKGIGKAISKLFAKNGYLTLINYNKSEDAAKKLCSDLIKQGFLADCFKADLKSFDEISEMFKSIYVKYKKVDVLVNNAGISLIKEFTKTTEPEWDEIMSVNLKSAFLCSKFALEKMLEMHRGKIINISSMWGETGGSFEVAYSASKAGLIGFTKALAKEVSPNGINVNAVTLGFIDTEMNKEVDTASREKIRYDTPLLRLGEVNDAANAVYFLASEKSDFITGEVIKVNGGLVI